MIHPTAIIDPSAQIGQNVRIGPFCIVGENVVLGDDCVLHSHVVIRRDTTIGKQNEFYQFSSIGEDCQDKKYAGEPTKLVIGDNNIFREFTSVHRGTIQDKSITQIGDNGLFMANSHIAHDCIIGDNCIVANGTQVAGHVHLGDFVILGGMTAVHQFCHIGAHAFTGGGAIILKDVPPYVMVNGQKNIPQTINAEGLKRRGFSSEAIAALKKAYRLLYRSQLTLAEATIAIAELAQTHHEAQILVDFLNQPNRGIIR